MLCGFVEKNYVINCLISKVGIGIKVDILVFNRD